MNQTSTTAIRRAAMDLLARREHSFLELTNKLRKRFPESLDDLQAVVQRLSDEGLQSDSRMVEAFVRSSINRGQGPLKIRAGLRNRGISEHLIDTGIQTAEVDWYALIEQVSERKFGTADVMDLRDKGRRARFLQQRGFDFEQIHSVLS